jgi:WD40 repeat protein
MSILDKKLPQTPVHKSRGKRIIISIILVALVLILLAFTDISNDVALVVHFFAPPGHFTYHGHSGYVSAVAWSPDGKRIASASGDGTVQVWNASSGTTIYTYRGHDKDVFCLAWSPDGRYIASGGLDTTVQVWDAGNGNRVYTFHAHTDAVFSVAWSPDGTRIASASEDGTVQVWDAMTGGNVFTLVTAHLSGVLPFHGILWRGRRMASA